MCQCVHKALRCAHMTVSSFQEKCTNSEVWQGRNLWEGGEGVITELAQLPSNAGIWMLNCIDLGQDEHSQ